MGLFTRHIKSTLLLLGYAGWWIYITYWFVSGAAAYPNSCGAANGALIIITLLISFLYIVPVLIICIVKKGQTQKDFKIFAGIILAPFAYILISSFF
jgi:hypothetical protein